MFSRLPIRWRSTVWYGVLLAATYLLIGGALYVALRYELYDSFHEQLTNEAALAATGIQAGSGAFTIDAETRAAVSDDEHFIQVYGPDGALVLDTGGTNGRPSSLDSAIAAGMAGESSTLTRSVNGTIYGMSVTPVRDQASIAGVAVIGASRGDEDDLLRLVLITLGLAAPLVGCVAVVGGYLLAGRALAPVTAITELAGTIGEDDLHARLDLDLPDDELGRLARTFDDMLARIESAFERQRRFTGDAAHELRTPAAAMRSEIDLALIAPRSAADYRAAFERLDGDLERLTALLAALLQLACADANRLVIERVPFDVAETIAAVVSQYAVQAAATGIELVAETTPAIALGDEDLIIQVLINLLTNALRATSAGGRIVLGCRSEAGLARVWVEDDGIGLAAADRERVFERFYRADQGRSREAGGAGLGLSICREIVTAHGGAIALTSELGRGTRVELTIPAS